MKSIFATTRITLTATLFLTTIVITPWFSFDSINTPKTLVLAIGGSILCTQLLMFKKDFFQKEYQLVAIIMGAFFLWSVVAFLNSDMNPIEGIFGVDGRKTGVLTYFFFCVIFYIAYISSSIKQSKSLVTSLICSGILSIIYAGLQIINLDPFNWNTQYRAIFGFFGNPNFLAAFIGMSASAALVHILVGQPSRIKQSSLVLYIILVLIVIYQSGSEQGFFVLITGFSITSYILIKYSLRFRKYHILYLISLVIGFFIVLIDIFQKAPWKSFLFSDSIGEREEFWQSALKMTINNPVSGIGLDGFRDNYHRYRDLSAAVRDPGARVTSAHNVFLDISSGGGFPLLFLYLLITFMVIKTFIKVISKPTKPDVYFISIASAWFGYLIQSFISINHLGIAIWGWALGGAILGYEIKSKTNFDIVKSKNIFAQNISIVIGLIIGLTIATPELIKDAEFRSAMKSGNGDKIIALSTEWPQSMDRINLASGIFLENGFANQAVQIANSGVKFNSENLLAWQILYSIPEIPAEQKAIALSRIKELDPLNPQFKND